MKKAVFIILFLIVMALMLGETRSSIGKYDDILAWRMYHFGPNHSGYTTSLAPQVESLRWKYKADDFVFSSPAVADGIVFVGSSDNRVYALNELTGTQVWNYSTAGSVESSPSVIDGYVFVGSDDGNVYALNEVNGQKIWSYKTGGPLLYSSPTVVDGLVLVGSSNGTLCALKESSGKKIWSRNIGLDGLSSCAIDDGTVFIGGYGQKIYALNEQTGTDVWNYDTGAITDEISSPAVANGMVFISDPVRVYALNETSGTRIWSFAILSSGTHMFSSPAVADGMVFAGAYPVGFYALNETTGALVWTTYEKTWIGCDFSSPAIANGVVYVGAFDNNIYALNESTGVVIWNRYIGNAGASYVEASPAIADNMLFMGGLDNIYCFGPSVNVKPVLEVVSPSNNSVLSSSDVTVQWNCSSIISVDHYSVKLDNDTWIDVGDNNTATFKGLVNGNHTVYVQAFDRGGLNGTILSDFIVSTQNLTPEIVVLVGVIIVVVVISVYLGLRRKMTKQLVPPALSESDPKSARVYNV